MLSVDEALARVLALAEVSEPEDVDLRQAAGRVLARDVIATHSQPPFRTATMDGFAIFGDVAAPGATFTLIGMAQAGKAFDGTLRPGEAIRIFTGAPVPPESARVIIQEDVVADAGGITLTDKLDHGANIRAVGADFAPGARLAAPRRLGAFDIALAAAMNQATLTVHRRPKVAVIATGDELVSPGTPLGADQIIASNSYGIAALLEAEGAIVDLLPIARDTSASLKAAFQQAEGADLIVTIGGASVGEHDLVKQVAGELGMTLDFWKIAMRPGKPLIAGRLKGRPLIGLPGNPVSALICAVIFLVPLVARMQGLPAAPRPLSQARLLADLPANGPRRHYLRAELGQDGVRAFDNQDSALLSVLTRANALIVRDPNDPPRMVGDMVAVLPL